MVVPLVSLYFAIKSGSRLLHCLYSITIPVYVELAHKKLCLKIWITLDKNEIWAWDLYHSTALVEAVKFSTLKRKGHGKVLYQKHQLKSIVYTCIVQCISEIANSMWMEYSAMQSICGGAWSKQTTVQANSEVAKAIKKDFSFGLSFAISYNLLCWNKSLNSYRVPYFVLLKQLAS